MLIESNFYYSQEDLLFEYCKKHDISWNVVRPSYILGAVPEAANNLCYPLAVYASVCKRLGEPLRFPSDIAAWETQIDHSSAMMDGYFEEWTVLSDHVANEAFNIADDSAFTWGKFWPKLAGWYGIEYTRPDENAPYKELKTRSQVPRGFGPPATMRYTFSLVKWAKRPEVEKVLKDIAQEYDLAEKQLRDADRIFTSLDLCLTLSLRVSYR